MFTKILHVYARKATAAASVEQKTPYAFGAIIQTQIIHNGNCDDGNFMAEN